MWFNFTRIGAAALCRTLGAGALKIDDGSRSRYSDSKPTKDNNNLSLLKGVNSDNTFNAVIQTFGTNYDAGVKKLDHQLNVDCKKANFGSKSHTNDGPRTRSKILDALNFLNDNNDRCLLNKPSRASNDSDSKLSLYIAEYESNGNENDSPPKASQKPVEIKRYLPPFDFLREKENEPFIPEIMNFKASQKLLVPSELKIRNPFEFPRQDNEKVPDPEVSQFNATQRLISPNHPLNAHLLNAPNQTCYFSSERINVYESKPRPKESAVSCSCSGTLIRFNELNNLTDFPNVMEKQLILARGGGDFKLDLSNEHTRRFIDNLSICEEHRKELSANWEMKKYSHVITRRKKEKGIDSAEPVCSMPTPFGVNHGTQANRPYTCRHKVSFEEASAFLEANGILVHPGIPVCNGCSEYLKKLSVKEENIKPTTTIDSDDSDVDMESDVKSSSLKDVESGRPRDAKVKAIAALHETTENGSFLDSESGPSKEEQVAELITKIGELTGLSVPKANKKFDDLKPDTQQRKAAVLQNFEKIIAQHIAPDNPTALIKLAKSGKQTINESAGEKAMKDLCCMIKAQYNVAESDRERTAVLSQIALSVPLEALRREIPGMTTHQWRTARRQARERMERWKQNSSPQIRVRYDRESIDTFVEFITSAAVMAGLPYGTKVAKLPDGRKFDIPSTLRKQGDAEIIRMFEHYVEERGLNVKISPSVMRNILQVCAATRMKALECVDYFEAAGKTGFEKLINRLDKLLKMKLVDDEWRKEVQEELEECKLYLRTDYRLHIDSHSNVAEHCINYSLSDSQNAEFRGIPCHEDPDFPHSHNGKCERCIMFPQTIKKIYEKLDALLDEDEETRGDHDKVNEIKEEVKTYEKRISDWKMHIMRAAHSEQIRLKMIEKLKDNEAMVTFDYSQKWLPRWYRESQLDFFGKKGISWHITHVLVKKDGKKVQHSFVHVLGFEDQNACAVTAIMNDVLLKLKACGINAVSFRSDNAGYYRNAALITSIPDICKKTGVIVKEYSYCEPQTGKGPSDREGARIKCRMNSALNSGCDITTSEEMFSAITYGQKRLEGITAVTASVSNSPKEECTAIPGISFYSHVEFNSDDNSFTVWKHHGIGKGKKITSNKAALNNELEIDLTTSETPQSTDYMFWRDTGSVVEKKKKKKDSVPKAGKSDDEDDTDDETGAYKMFQCTEPNCIKKYVHYGNLVNHIEKGKHEYRPLKKTLYDYTLTKYGEELDDLQERRLEFYAQRTVQDCVTTDDSAVKEGWALRSNAKNKRFSNDVHKFVEELLAECVRNKKRFDPKRAEEAMEAALNANGKSRFSPSERLTSTQLSGLAQRKFKKMESQNVREINEDTLQNDRTAINDEIENDTGDFEIEFEDDPNNITTLEALQQYVRENESIIDPDANEELPKKKPRNAKNVPKRHSRKQQ